MENLKDVNAVEQMGLQIEAFFAILALLKGQPFSKLISKVISFSLSRDLMPNGFTLMGISKTVIATSIAGANYLYHDFE